MMDKILQHTSIDAINENESLMISTSNTDNYSENRLSTNNDSSNNSNWNPQLPIKKGIIKIYLYQKNQRDEIILTFENGTILVIFSTDIIKINIFINMKRQPIMFECLINMIPQDTTTDGNQTHNIIQNLEFGLYLFMVYMENTTELKMK